MVLVDYFVPIAVGGLVGFLTGILLPVLLAFISHAKHKLKHPDKPDTHSGAFSFVIIILAPTFAVIGGFLGLLYKAL